MAATPPAEAGVPLTRRRAGAAARRYACEQHHCIDSRAPPVIVDSGAIHGTATCRHLHDELYLAPIRTAPWPYERSDEVVISALIRLSPLTRRSELSAAGVAS